jgi:hypothetical protein
MGEDGHAKAPPIDLDPYNLPGEYLAALGLITACSAQAEDRLNDAIAALSETDYFRGAAISAHMSAPMRRDVVRTLAQLSTLPLEALEELDDILDRIELGEKLRNEYVHRVWGQDRERGTAFYVHTKARGEFSMDLFNVTVEELHRDAGLIHYAGVALSDFLLKHGLRPKRPADRSDLAERGKTERARQRKKQRKEGSR